MSAIVRMVARAGYLGITGDEVDKTAITPDNMALNVPAGDVVRIGGKSDGTLVEDGIIEANQTVIIRPGVRINPVRYNIITSYNPQLAASGAQVTVGAPIVGKGEGESIFLTIRTSKKLDINDLDYVFRFYIVD